MDHYKKARKIAGVFLSLVIVFSCVNVSSDEERFLTRDIVINHSGLSIGSISVDGNTIVIDDVAQEYAYLMLELKRDGEVAYKRTEKVRDHKAKFKTNIREGEYKLFLFHNYSDCGVFDSVLNGDLTLCFFGGEGRIAHNRQVLKQNLLIKSQEIISDEALEFFLKPSQDIESDDAAIISISEEITKGCHTQYEKLIRIHDWIANNIFYNMDYKNGKAEYGDQSAKSVLASRVGVCSGYANLMVAISRAAGIPARKVLGTYYAECPMDEGPNHAWSEAYVDNTWKIIDVTFDTDNKFEDGQRIQRKGCRSHLNFDISSEGLSMDRLIVRNNLYNKLFLYKGYSKMNKNGKEWITLDSGTAPMLIKNRIFIPVRAVVECMGGEVLFYKDGNYDKIRIFVSDHDIQMWVGHSTYFVDGTENKFDSPPQIVGGRAVIPLRSVFESIGCTVTWDSYADNWYGRVTIGYVE